MLKPFCDWLDVTFQPTDCPTVPVTMLLLELGYTLLPSAYGRGLVRYAPPGAASTGELQIHERRSHVRVSASGSVCRNLSMCGAWEEFLTILGSSPHTVTRLDLAVDLEMDGADLVDAMRARYASGTVNLGRKAIGTTLFLSVRPDGRETGTWYAGHRTKARATARVYDKAHQLWERDGTITSPRARVEVTARKGYGATLRDAALPEALFWHIASPAILQAPEDAPLWTPNHDLSGWQAPPRDRDAASALRRGVESLSGLDALAAVADAELGPQGRAYLASLLCRHLGLPTADIVPPPVALCSKAS